MGANIPETEEQALLQGNPTAGARIRVREFRKGATPKGSFPGELGAGSHPCVLGRNKPQDFYNNIRDGIRAPSLLKAEPDRSLEHGPRLRRNKSEPRRDGSQRW